MNADPRANELIWKPGWPFPMVRWVAEAMLPVRAYEDAQPCRNLAAPSPPVSEETPQ
jgi:hypothetical protein